MHVRWMIRRDMNAVLASEQTNSPQLKAMYGEWGEKEYLVCLGARNTIGMIIEELPTQEFRYENPVVGHMIYELFKTRLEILRFIVAPSHRHAGYGSAMVNKLKSKLSSHRRTKLKFTVHEQDLGSQLFLRRCGLLAKKVVRNQFEEGDGYVFEYRTPDEVLVLDEAKGFTEDLW